MVWLAVINHLLFSSCLPLELPPPASKCLRVVAWPRCATVAWARRRWTSYSDGAICLPLQDLEARPCVWNQASILAQQICDLWLL